MKIGYYINETFTLDDGRKNGVNVMFFGGQHDMSFWFDEKHFKTVDEAKSYIENMEDEMIPVIVKD